MSAKVTLHIFSGRPDPEWIISNEQLREFTALIEKRNKVAPLAVPQIATGLGYRGFTVIPSDTNMENGVDPTGILVGGGLITTPAGDSFFAQDSEVEKWLLSTATAETVPAEVAMAADNALTEREKQGTEALEAMMAQVGIAPPYIPGEWNAPHTCNKNNCYNYACNRQTNTFAQPGRAHGMVINPGNAASVRKGAEEDRLIHLGAPYPGPEPATAHFIALAIWPGQDFHWWRRDVGGFWSHKPGATPVINTDNADQAIANPNACNRGPYTAFAGYFAVYPNVIIN